MFKLISNSRKLTFLRRTFSISSISECEETKRKPKRKVSETVELVTLVDQNDKILGLKPKHETEKLARKLNLMLERVTDVKYGKTHPAFKLVSNSDMLKAEPVTSAVKHLKRLPINCRINENDLVIKIKTVQKWLTKGYEVHVAITGNSGKSTLMENIFKKIEEHLKDESRFLDVRRREEALKFIILPPKQPSSKKSESSVKPENSTVNEVDKTDT